jgi:hypothetical protein
VAIGIPILPLAIGLFRIRILSREMRFLFLLLTVGFTTDLLNATIFLRTQYAPWLVHFYNLVELGMVMLIVSFWQESQKVKRLFQILTAAYVLFWLYAKFALESLDGSYYLTGSISAVILVLSAGYTFFLVIGNRVQPLLNDYRFWVLLSFVVYYICILLPIALQSVIFSRSKELLIIAWAITWIATIISNIIFAIGFLCPQTQA